MAKNCPFCNYPNFNDAHKCKSCGQDFDDVIKCTYCGTNNIKTWSKCIKCKKDLIYSKNNYDNNNKKENEDNKKTILFDCIVCKNSFSINVTDNFNVFICKNCRSIFLYEWKNNKLVINVVKKEDVIPINIKKLFEFFDLEYPSEQEDLKKKYHKKLSQYHPDKVSHLGKEFKELSEQKTKEIIKNYELLQNWLKNK